LFGNPSSLHQTGKKSRKFINEASDYLFKTFTLDKNNYHLFYHSGATEGINTFFKGMALKYLKEKNVLNVFINSIVVFIDNDNEIKVSNSKVPILRPFQICDYISKLNDRLSKEEIMKIKLILEENII